VPPARPVLRRILVGTLVALGVLVVVVPIAGVTAVVIAKRSQPPPALPDRQGTELFASRGVLEPHVSRQIGTGRADDIIMSMPDTAPGDARIVLGAPEYHERWAQVTALLVSSAPDRYYVCETFRVEKDPAGIAVDYSAGLGRCPRDLADRIPADARIAPPHTMDG
jgi:hypothetical protein